MKLKKLIVSLMVIFVTVLLFVSCSNGQNPSGNEQQNTPSQTEEDKDKKYTVSIDTNGGTSLSNLQLRKGEAIIVSTPTKEGYTFAGWYTDADLSFEFNDKYMPAKNITLYAKWTENVFTINFKTFAPQNIDSITAKQGEVITLPKIEMEGYTFLGWYLDEECTNRFSSNLMPNKNLTLYANWDFAIRTLSFSFKVNDMDAYSNPISGIPGTEITLPSPEKNDYKFSGWYYDEEYTIEYTDSVIPNDNLTIYGKMERVLYNVTLVNEFAEEDIVKGYTSSSRVDLPTPTKEEYDFLGWYTNADYSGEAVGEYYTVEYSDVSLYAKWRQKQYTVEFVTGIQNVMFENVTIIKGDVLELPTILMKHYSFEGWYYDARYINEVKSGDVINVDRADNGIIRIYAKCTLLQYTITYFGVAVESYVGLEDDVVNLPQLPNTTNKKFVGWYLTQLFEGECYTTQFILSNEDVTLYPKYEDITYKITFVTNIPGYDDSKLVYEYKKDEVVYYKDIVESIKICPLCTLGVSQLEYLEKYYVVGKQDKCIGDPNDGYRCKCEECQCLKRDNSYLDKIYADESYTEEFMSITNSDATLYLSWISNKIVNAVIRYYDFELNDTYIADECYKNYETRGEVGTKINVSKLESRSHDGFEFLGYYELIIDSKESSGYRLGEKREVMEYQDSDLGNTVYLIEKWQAVGKGNFNYKIIDGQAVITGISEDYIKASYENGYFDNDGILLIELDLSPEIVDYSGKKYKVSKIEANAFDGNKQVEFSVNGKNVKLKYKEMAILIIICDCEVEENAFVDCEMVRYASLTGNYTGEQFAKIFNGAKKLMAIEILGDFSVNKGDLAEFTELMFVEVAGKATINDGSFENNTKLSGFDCGDNSVIYDDAFDGCSLSALYMGDNCEIIGDGFVSYQTLVSVKIGANLKAPSSAFYDDYHLYDVRIKKNSTYPANLTYYAIKVRDYDEDDITYPDGEFVYLVYSDMIVICGYNGDKTSVTIPYIKEAERPMMLAPNLFRDTNVYEVTIEEGYETINKAAFYYAKDLKIVNLPSTITQIESYAFAYSGIVSINLPKNLKTIEKYAFLGVNSLAYIKNLSSISLTIGSSDYDGLAKNAFAISTVESDVSPITIVNGLVIYTKNENGNDVEYVIAVTDRSKRYDLTDKGYIFSKHLTKSNYVELILSSKYKYVFSGDLAPMWIIFYKGTPDDFSKNIVCGDTSDSTVFYYSETQPTDENHSYYYLDENGDYDFW